MRRCMTLCLILLIGLSGTVTHAQGASVPRFEKADCQFEIPTGRTVECGYLVVPEDRSKPDGPTIQLAVGIVKALNTHPASDPVLYLDGGPGGYTLETLQYSFDVFKPFATKRDLIVFDQRGVGDSLPALDCPEDTKVSYDTISDNLTVAESSALHDKALQNCHDRLVKKGINLSAYNTAENAADVHDLRVALNKEYGYSQWNLFGISYGTRLALTEMRDFPDGVRSVILDSTVPLQVDLFARIPANADRAFKVFFDGCKKDSACNKAYPNLESVFYKLADTLAAKPATVSTLNPLTFKSYDVLINGDVLIDTLFQSLYSSELIPYLPAVIYNAHKGNYATLADLVMNDMINNEFFSAGMYYSVQCAEEVSFETPQTLINADKNFPKQRDVLDMGDFATVCKMWNVHAAPAVENQAVTSDLPTLVLSGEYDPITPPTYGQEAAKTLKNSTWLLFPGLGHGVSISDRCPLNISLAFIDAPDRKPDGSCIDTMHPPKFAIAK